MDKRFLQAGEQDHSPACVAPSACALRPVRGPSQNTGPDGLSSDDAAARLDKFGPNELPAAPDASFDRLVRILTRPMSLFVWVAIAVEMVDATVSGGSGGYWADVSILLTLQAPAACRPACAV